MQCTSFSPVYYHARDLNVGANGYSWQLYDSKPSCGEERGYAISMPLRDQCSGFDKEVLKQIILNHEATFRYQVQELHRLYRRQRDLMDESRMREMFAHHLLSRTSESIHSSSHTGADLSQNFSSATNCLFGDLASIQGPKDVVAENLEEPATLRTDSFVRKNSFDNAQSKENGNETIRLELAADILYHDDKVGSLCTPEEISNFRRPSDSDTASMKTWDVSSSCSNIRKTNCFFDLNEPIQLESMPTSSSGPLDAFTNSDGCVPIEAIPESAVTTQSQFRKSDDSSSYGMNSSMTIDLNSMPENCFSETDMNLESPPSVNIKAEVVLDCSFAYNKIGDSFSKTETYINSNSGVVDAHSQPRPQPRSTSTQSAEDTELKGPESPENEERSPPRGKSEDTQLETPLSSEQGDGEPLTKAETIAAETLAKMVASFRNLCWFAEFVSSTGDDLESRVMELENDKSEDNALNLSHFKKPRGASSVSRSSGKGRKRGKKQSQECVKTGRLKRKTSKSGCAKPRKYTKLSPSDAVRKSMSSMLKQSAARMDLCVLQSWGKTRNRQGGRRRRARISFSLAELGSF